MASDSLRLPDRSARWSIDEKTLCYVSIALVAIRLPISMASRFWLDETHTYWATNGGFRELYSRCIAYPLSIAYTAMFCAIRELGGHREWVFRIPSLLAFALSVWFLFRLSRRLFDDRVAWFTTAVFLQLAPVIYAATDARPCAFGLLFAIVSTDLLVRLAESPSAALAAGYGASAGMVLHFHLLLGVILVVHALFLCYLFANGRRIRVSQLAAAAAAFVVIILPIAFQGLWALQHAPLHLFQPHPTAYELAQTLAPARLAAVLLAALLLTLIVKRRLGWDRLNWDAAHLVLVMLWMLVPPLLYFVVASVSEFVVFFPRYLICYSPGLALCFGVTIASLKPRTAGYLFLGLIAVMSASPLLFQKELRHTYNRGDWGEALAYVQKEAHWIPVQLTLTPQQTSYLESSFDTDVRRAKRFLFVSFTGPVGYRPYLDYFRSKVGPGHARQLADFDGIDVFEFVKPDEPPTS
jgi:mannosyltransferase